MPLKLEQLKEMHEKAFSYNQTTRERASEDLVFYWVTQWDDSLLNDSQLSYKGEFNIIRKGGRQIMSDLRTNPVQVKFDPKDPDRDDDADLANGLYRREDRQNFSIEAHDFASQDAVVCGFGAWERYTEYETNSLGDRKQVMKKRFIPEANNTAFCDPSAKAIDRSDAHYWSILDSYTPEGYCCLRQELTGDDSEDVDTSNFASPEDSMTFPWIQGSGEFIFVTSFYHKEKIKDKILFFEDPLGMQTAVNESELEDVIDDMLDLGFKVIHEKEIERWVVRKYIASGEEILNGEMGPEGEREGEIIPGEHIPVIPVWGECSWIEQEWHYEGVTALAKDPQRLHNFVQSYLADIASRSPRPKAIYHPEQVQGFEPMYELAGSENNYPYLLANRFDINGQLLPAGPIGQTPDTPIPAAISATIDLTRQAISDVVDPGLPQNIADPDLSGKAVTALQSRIDQQSYIFQHNLKMAKRYDGEVWASMARSIYDAPCTVTVEGQDGKSKKVKMMESIYDPKTGEMKVINDLTNVEFDVFSDIGPSYKTQRQEDMEQLQNILASLQPTDPLHSFITLQLTTMMDGHEFEALRKFAHKQMLTAGYVDPETDEDKQTVQKAMQAASQKQDPNMVLAQGELMKGQAALKAEQVKEAQLQVEMQKLQLEQAKINTSAAAVGIKAQEAKADIANTNMDTLLKDANRKKISGESVGVQIDNAQKVLPQQAIG